MVSRLSVTITDCWKPYFFIFKQLLNEEEVGTKSMGESIKIRFLLFS